MEKTFLIANIKSKGIADDGIYGNSIRGFLNTPPNYPTYDDEWGAMLHLDISADITNPVGLLYYNNFNENKINRYVGNIFTEARLSKRTYFQNIVLVLT